MLHTVSIIFNDSICFDRLGDTFFTRQSSRFGKELESITNNKIIIIIVVFNLKTARSSFWPRVKREMTQNTHSSAAVDKILEYLSLPQSKPQNSLPFPCH